jgi:hypothetical protein
MNSFPGTNAVRRPRVRADRTGVPVTTIGAEMVRCPRALRDDFFV